MHYSVRMTLDMVNRVISNLEYENYSFTVDVIGENVITVKVVFDTICTISGEPLRAECRPWIVENESTESEVVRTIYKATEAAVVHELQEKFKYNGKVVYDPHTQLPNTKS